MRAAAPHYERRASTDIHNQNNWKRESTELKNKEKDMQFKLTMALVIVAIMFSPGALGAATGDIILDEGGSQFSANSSEAIEDT